MLLAHLNTLLLRQHLSGVVSDLFDEFLRLDPVPPFIPIDEVDHIRRLHGVVTLPQKILVEQLMPLLVSQVT